MAGAYRRLQPFDDARPALAVLRERGHSIVVVLSVGPRAWLEELAADAGGYKPHPRHLLGQAGTEPSVALLVPPDRQAADKCGGWPVPLAHRPETPTGPAPASWA